MSWAFALTSAASLALLFSGAQAQTPANGLVGHWTLDEAGGAKLAVDSSGHGNPAKCGAAMSVGSGRTQPAKCPVFGVPGKNGTAADFQGSGNFLVVDNTIPKSFTVTGWIKTAQTGEGSLGGAAYQGTGIVWSDTSGAAADMIPMSLLAGHLAFGTGDCGDGGYDTVVSKSRVNTGKWLFVAVTRDTATGDKKIYVDGRLDASRTNTGACALDATRIISFGGNPLDGRYFKGALDDIAFYDRALSADEILSLAKPPPAQMAAQTKSEPAAAPMPAANAPVKAAGSDPFTGTWAADMSTVPPQQPPLKSQAYDITATSGGYITKLVMVQLDKSGGTSQMTIGGKILFGGKPYKGGMGETRSCNPVDLRTIRCAISMGPNKMEETLTLSADGKGLTDSMKVKGPDGKDHLMTTAYSKTSSAAPANMPVVATGAGQSVVTHNGECEIAIPAGWTVDQSMRQASAPDHGVEARVFTTNYASNMKTLAQLKALNVHAYKPVKTFEDTPARLWYQYAPHYQNDNGWYVAVLGKTGTCNLEISFRNSVIPDPAAARKIALSLKTVR